MSMGVSSNVAVPQGKSKAVETGLLRGSYEPEGSRCCPIGLKEACQVPSPPEGAAHQGEQARKAMMPSMSEVQVRLVEDNNLTGAFCPPRSPAPASAQDEQESDRKSAATQRTGCRLEGMIFSSLPSGRAELPFQAFPIYTVLGGYDKSIYKRDSERITQFRRPSEQL